MAKILLVEDDIELGEMIGRWMENQHHTVEIVNDGSEGYSRLKHFAYDLAILDWNLPGIEGIAILKQIRSAGNTTAVLMLTGKSKIDDRLAGFHTGADDYLVKPFHGKELMARVEALLRRPRNYAGSAIKCGSLELDAEAFKVKQRGIEIKLQPREFTLLHFLMKNPGKLFTAEKLIELVWENDSDASREALTTCIKRLRKKLDIEGTTSVIRNVHGAGYGIEKEQ
ncbi:MAG: two-component system, OmpR family, manganese sensing response regulator [Cyanobacteriota bacterium erpe_2018_sw_21hr_WHONDRS-SW48-000092_B_bin.40]|nr:two-component system, OmpR family, manganese sensing response regulator [Cyanobacteriota bacterium erpe_2018_sw_21hr_WHONDRS-SW48-000092_B_bin.40]